MSGVRFLSGEREQWRSLEEGRERVCPSVLRGLLARASECVGEKGRGGGGGRREIAPGARFLALAQLSRAAIPEKTGRAFGLVASERPTSRPTNVETCSPPTPLYYVYFRTDWGAAPTRSIRAHDTNVQHDRQPVLYLADRCTIQSSRLILNQTISSVGRKEGHTLRIGDRIICDILLRWSIKQIVHSPLLANGWEPKKNHYIRK